MARIVIIGCGVVGAAIAYELSRTTSHTLTVLEQHSPAEGATGAALGIAMGVISHKVKGRNWRLREASLRRYPTLLSELAELGQPVPHNSQGILSLCFEAESLPRWQSLQAIRQRQGWPLEIWSPDQVAAACPHLSLDQVVAGIYSPQDLQIMPAAFTQALINAAQQQGAELQTDTAVVGFEQEGDRVQAVQTASQTYPADVVIVTAGLGSERLAGKLDQMLPMMPVLGQGLRIQMPEGLGDASFQPVINGDDVHLVPMGDRVYGVAATVEFPPDGERSPLPEAAAIEAVWQAAIEYCPALKAGNILSTWYGLRPRPQGQAAPVIQPMEGIRNGILATGHYRNGVLLAPATALKVQELLQAILDNDSSMSPSR
ncbi:NAD(P)/FAD-dependent oxidoreductase [Leptolyngbya iicbica]|uniref:FAD-binding oxidoreductase n=2 Tax=Cyanophyceae TaxID=3028117 RepID=A0A4Q7E4S9_9CYAN|nr:FAD-dependent oxidoreductase [Leptolyngbya sp. LK]RZM75062.1 FAD-binding oxidoreductase [Leptolyngbya sp. LK]